MRATRSAALFTSRAPPRDERPMTTERTSTCARMEVTRRGITQTINRWRGQHALIFNCPIIDPIIG